MARIFKYRFHWIGPEQDTGYLGNTIAGSGYPAQPDTGHPDQILPSNILNKIAQAQNCHYPANPLASTWYLTLLLSSTIFCQVVLISFHRPSISPWESRPIK